MKYYIITGISALAISFVIALPVAFMAAFTAKKKHGASRMSPVKFVFIWYMLFLLLGVFYVFNRNTQLTYIYNIKFLHSYAELFARFEWSKFFPIFFNFVLFVPFGILFNAAFREKKISKYTALFGFGLICVIELVQLALQIGIADIDDLFTDMVGVLYGDALYRVYAMRPFRKKKWHRSEKWTLAYSGAAFTLPLVIIGLYFLCNLGEHGALELEYRPAEQSLSAAGDTASLYAQLPGEANVYALVEQDKEQCTEKMEDIFHGLGYEISELYRYENCYVAYSPKREYDLWYYFKSGTFTISNFNDKSFAAGDDPGQRLLDMLEEMNVAVPDGASFTEIGEGEYRMEVDFEEIDGVIYDGSISFELYNGLYDHISYELYPLQLHGSLAIPPFDEVSSKLEAGEFFFYYTEYIPDLSEITVCDIGFDYVLDTKNIYRPLIEFIGTAKGGDCRILVSPTDER